MDRPDTVALRRRWRGAFSSLGRARPGKLVSIMDQAIEDRIRDCRVWRARSDFRPFGARSRREMRPAGYARKSPDCMDEAH